MLLVTQSRSMMWLSVALLLLPCAALAAPADAHFLMPWMCLERCGGNASTIAANLEQLRTYAGLITAASYEEFNLGAGGSLVTNNLTKVGPTIKAMGLGTHAMISSYRMLRLLLPVCLPVCPSAHLPVCVPVFLCVCVSVYLCVCVSVCHVCDDLRGLQRLT
jgi:hypothetical protein